MSSVMKCCQHNLWNNSPGSNFQPCKLSSIRVLGKLFNLTVSQLLAFKTCFIFLFRKISKRKCLMSVIQLSTHSLHWKAMVLHIFYLIIHILHIWMLYITAIYYRKGSEWNFPSPNSSTLSLTAGSSQNEANSFILYIWSVNTSRGRMWNPNKIIFHSFSSFS